MTQLPFLFHLGSFSVTVLACSVESAHETVTATFPGSNAVFMGIGY